MIAYHFPPLAGSSGIQRTLRFVQHLPSLGWQPLVLTANPRAYERVSSDLLEDIPVGTVVRRAFALDAARHLQIAGRYFGWMARPDRWISWRHGAVHHGLKLIKQFKPDVVWSTYPIPTAHVIASILHRKTGIPWIADFRDPMAHEGFPADPLDWQSYLEVEADAVAHAQLCTFTSPGALAMYQHRYPTAARRMAVLENGYDEESFQLPLPTVDGRATTEVVSRPVVLLHSGIVYASERDPTQLFVALGRLLQEGALGPDDLRIRFRASKNDGLLRHLAHANGALAFIELCPAIGYRDALAEMMNVDALLVMQASNCNAQIPAKIYEYLRAGRPILGLTDPDGDTAGVMRLAGLPDIVPLDSADAIYRHLPRLVRTWRNCQGILPYQPAVKQASRGARSKVFATLLELTSAAKCASDGNG